MTSTTETLNDLIEIARDGKNFYEHALTEVKNPELKALFTEIAQSKAKIISALSSQVSAAGEKPAEQGTFAGSFRKYYTDVKTSFASKEKEEVTYVSELEEQEDRLLHALERAVNEHATPDAQANLRSQLEKARATHDRMRDLKHRMQAAH